MGHGPYTFQFGQCGVQGEFIHFTPEFILNDDLQSDFGARGNVNIPEVLLNMHKMLLHMPELLLNMPKALLNTHEALYCGFVE